MSNYETQKIVEFIASGLKSKLDTIDKINQFCDRLEDLTIEELQQLQDLLQYMTTIDGSMKGLHDAKILIDKRRAQLGCPESIFLEGISLYYHTHNPILVAQGVKLMMDASQKGYAPAKKFLYTNNLMI